MALQERNASFALVWSGRIRSGFVAQASVGLSCVTLCLSWKGLSRHRAVLLGYIASRPRGALPVRALWGDVRFSS